MSKKLIEAIVKELSSSNYEKLELLNQTPVAKLVFIAKKADDAYYNHDEPIMSDREYDRLEEMIRKRDPANKYLSKIGAEASSSSVYVDLPVNLFSQDKRKDSKTVDAWIEDFGESVVISNKLDGISGLYFNIDGQDPKLYSRGTSSQGQDLSRLLQYLDIPKVKCIARGELIISKTNFEKLKRNYESGKISFKSNKFPANGRSLVAGQVNSKIPDPEIMKYVEFIAYELIEPKKIISDQLKWLKKHKFNIVDSGTTKRLNFDILVEVLNEAKESTQYDIDGIVVVSNSDTYPNPTERNPKYSFAFKQESDEQKADGIVDRIEWNLTRYGVLSPTVWFKDPVEIGGTTIKKVTGKNAKFLIQNKIGSGAQVVIVRSGDVIPNIHSVIKPSKTVEMPKESYQWDETNTNLVIDEAGDQSEADNEINARLIENFFDKMKIANFGRGTIDKLLEKNFDTIPKIVNMKKKDFLKLDAIADVMASKLYNNMHQGISNATPEMWVAASSIMGKGMGKRKMKALLKDIPDFLSRKANNKKEREALIEEVSEVDGFADKTASQVVDNLLDFQKFMKSLNLEGISLEPPKKKSKTGKSNKYEGFVVVFTGFRDSELENQINDNGGTIGSSVSGKTTHLLVSDKSSTSSKIKKAEANGVKIMTQDEFKKL